MTCSRAARVAVRMLRERERNTSNRKKPIIDDVPPPAAQPEGIVTPWQEAVAEFNKTVLEAAAKLPGYTDTPIPDAPRLPRRVTSTAFIGTIVAAVDDHEQLRALDELDVAECRKTLQFSQAVQSAVDTLKGITRQLEVLARAKESVAGRSALRIYRLTRGLASNPKNSHLQPTVATMRAAMKRRFTRRTPSAPPEQGGAQAA